MKRTIRNIILFSATLLMLYVPTGCNSWLDLLPTNDQTTDRYWESKEEVEAVLASAYVQLRTTACQERYVLWGEMRGDGIALTSATSNAAKIKNLDILTTNTICQWSAFYTAIGYANSVLKYGPTVLDKDPTFTQELMNSYAAEAVFIRSLCYFYLVRTFNNVPLVTEPYVDDSQDYAVASSPEADVLAYLVTDLENNLNRCKTGYESDQSNPWQNKGRVTRWAYHALLADIYLWQGNYGRCIYHCDELEKSQKFRLMEKEDWFKNFYPGNTDENIFELQWSRSVDNSTSSFYNWYMNGENASPLSTYIISDKSKELFTETLERDVRGDNGSYRDATGKIWKFGGTDYKNVGGSIRPYQDNNWIFYRYADIRLMKAEALVMQGDLQGAKDIVQDEIRFRAGYNTQINLPANEYDGLMMVMQERQREFIGEGKRWFDILRVAKRNDFQYKQYLLDVLLESVSAKDYAVWASKLSDVNSYYLPIYKTEVDNGKGVLEQNPYYKDLD